MNNNETLRILKQLQQQEDNQYCFDCGAVKPQWISITLAIWVCCRCAGLHRSLGAHLSFIRSVKLDLIKPEELRRMQMGGNEKAADFFDEIKDFDEKADIRLKYRSKAAALYRDKLEALMHNKPWCQKEALERLQLRTVSIVKAKECKAPSDVLMVYEGSMASLDSLPNLAALKTQTLKLTISSLMSGWNLLSASLNVSSFLLKRKMMKTLQKIQGREGWEVIEGENFADSEKPIQLDLNSSYQNS